MGRGRVHVIDWFSLAAHKPLNSGVRPMKALALLILLTYPAVSFACGRSAEEPYRFHYYPQPGMSATTDGKIVKIDTDFVERLIANPSFDLFLSNSQELFYLLLTGHSSSQVAAARVLSLLITNPVLEEPCGGGTPQVAYGIEELAFVFSRTDFSALCKVSGRERGAIVAYYAEHPNLVVGPDRPQEVTCK